MREYSSWSWTPFLIQQESQRLSEMEVFYIMKVIVELLKWDLRSRDLWEGQPWFPYDIWKLVRTLLTWSSSSLVLMF